MLKHNLQDILDCIFAKFKNCELNKMPLSLDQQLKAFENVIMPDDTPIEIKSKLIVVLLNLGAKHLVRVSCNELNLMIILLELTIDLTSVRLCVHKG